VRPAEIAPHPRLAEHTADPEDQHSRHARSFPRCLLRERVRPSS
jgi:hypothetical protein